MPPWIHQPTGDSSTHAICLWSCCGSKALPKNNPSQTQTSRAGAKISIQNRFPGILSALPCELVDYVWKIESHLKIKWTCVYCPDLCKLFLYDVHLNKLILKLILLKKRRGIFLRAKFIEYIFLGMCRA